MEVIYTLTLRGLKMNKKRTLLTILTIILSVGMMTAVLCGSWSMLEFLQTKEKAYGGDYEYSIENLSLQQAESLKKKEDVEDVSLLSFVGNSFYGEKSNKSLLAIAGVDRSFIENFALTQYLLQGCYPANENEIVLTESFLEKNDLSFSVGETITLSVGSRIWDEIDAVLYGLTNYMGSRESFHPAQERTWLIVGILSDISGSEVAGNFNAFTGVDLTSTAQNLTAYVKVGEISKAVYELAEKNAADIGGQVSSFHSALLFYYGVTAGKGMRKLFLSVVCIILLLCAVSAAMISNVLSISLQERIKQLGILSSIGATKKQKRASIRLEAFFLGVVGIPMGLIAGIGLAFLVLLLIRQTFQTAFAVGSIRLTLRFPVWILLLCAASGMTALIFASAAPGRMAGKVTVIEVIRQSNIYRVKKKKLPHKGLASVVFGVYGALASRNIRRNPKRFRAITGSVFLAVVIGLSLYSLADFMTYQVSMDMREDGSRYTDVITVLQYKELPEAIKGLSGENISADISWYLARYLTTTVEKTQINPDMIGYFSDENMAEIYAVGLDQEHFAELCRENDFDASACDPASNRGILINAATGNYGVSQKSVVAGSPFRIESGASLRLDLDEAKLPEIIVQDVINGENAKYQSLFVRDRAILVLPLSCFDWMLDNDTYVYVNISTSQHRETAECLTDMGYFQTMDVAAATENMRQIYLILKLSVCIFAVLMILMIGLNVCNTMSDTIYVRRSEFAVLRSVGMTTKGLNRMLLLEAALYGIKALVLALPVSLIIHFVLYYQSTLHKEGCAYWQPAKRL
ncbi:MAG: ABC transporter permease [Roseburia sp.]|nr:ABC transporter permease [Roseburia sp.]MCM1098454.1 ABC transporter permease [Ruminococcus flavefaciens]